MNRLWLVLFLCGNLPAIQASATDASEQAIKSEIDRILDNHPSCKSRQVSDRGSIGNAIGYGRGSLYTFARTACRSKSDPVRVHSTIGQRSYRNDVLVYLNRNITPDDKETLITTSLLTLNLGFWESSGNPTEGIDKSAGATSEEPVNAEAGLFQFSVSGIAQTRDWGQAIWDLMEQYKQSPWKCMKEEFLEGVTEIDRRPSRGEAGTREYEFQEWARNCPAFAAEAARIFVRNNRRHFGPINRREAEPMEECRGAFEQVYHKTQTDPRYCEALALHPAPRSGAVSSSPRPRARRTSTN